MTSDAATVEEYLAGLPEERRTAMNGVREVILAHLPEGYQEKMMYGMIGYVVPHELFPAGYHCDPKQPLSLAMLGSQKNYMSLYLMSVYGHEPTREWFQDAYHATGKKLDMGKSCVRFKKLEDLPLEVIGQAIARVPARTYIEHYEQALRKMKESRGKKVATG
jgi:hypothetical protein